MTGTVQGIIQLGESQVGYIEGGGPDGRSGNITKYWAELAPGLQGQPWCAGYQHWLELHNGGPVLPISNPYYCPSRVTYARQHGLWLPADQGSPGDEIIFQWNQDGVADHTGRIRVKGAGLYKTNEGNTSGTDAGSQRNGGGVFDRDRYINGTVLGVIDYSKLLAHAAANGGLAPRNPVKGNPDAAYAAPCQQGDTGNKVRFVQWAVGVPVDGNFGPQTERAVKEFQHYHAGLVQDGVVGPKTIAVLRSVTH